MYLYIIKKAVVFTHGLLGNPLFCCPNDDLKTMGGWPLVKGATARVPEEEAECSILKFVFSLFPTSFIFMPFPKFVTF